MPAVGTGFALTTWGELTLAADPIYRRADWNRRSPWPEFAAARAAVGRPAWIVQAAVGGTCLVHDRDGVPPRWDPGTGDLYPALLTRVRDARNLGFPAPRAVLWHQGECDAEFPGTPAEVYVTYRDALLHLADRIGADLGLPLVAALIVPQGPRNLAVRSQSSRLPRFTPGSSSGPTWPTSNTRPIGSTSATS